MPIHVHVVPVRATGDNTGTPVVPVSQKELLTVLIKEIHRSTIIPLMEERMEHIFNGETEELLLSVLGSAAAKFLSDPFAKDGEVAIIFRTNALSYELLSKALGFANVKDVSVATIVKTLETLDETRIVWDEAKIKAKDKTKVTLVDFMDALFSLEPASIDPFTYSAEKIQSIVPPANIGEQFGRMIKTVGVPQHKEVLPDGRVQIQMILRLIEGALDGMVDPSKLFPTETNVSEIRIKDYISLAAGYAYYRHITRSESSHNASVAARMDAQTATGRMDAYRRVSANYAWLFMNFFMAGPRLIASITFDLYEEMRKLISTLPLSDRCVLNDLDALIKSHSPDLFPGGRNIFDDIHRKLFDSIRKAAGHPTAVLAVEGLVSRLKLGTEVERREPLVPMGWDGIVNWTPKILFTPAWDFEDELNRSMRAAFSIIRQTNSALAMQFRTIASPGHLEDADHFKFPSDLLKIDPVMEWVAKIDAIPVRNIENLPKGTVTVPKYVNDEPFWRSFTYRSLYFNQFISRFAEVEYATRRMYWPHLADLDMLDAFYAKFTRSYIPHMYVSDVIPSRGNDILPAALQSMLLQIGKECGIGSNFLGYTSKALIGDTYPGKIASGLSAMFTIYKVKIDTKVESRIPKGAEIVMPEIPTVYGIPFMLFENVQPESLKPENHVVVIPDVDNPTSKYIFKLHEVFPIPAATIAIPFFIGGSSWMDVPVEMSIFNEMLRSSSIRNASTTWAKVSQYVPNLVNPVNAKNMVPVTDISKEKNSFNFDHARTIISELKGISDSMARVSLDSLNLRKTETSAGVSISGGDGVSMQFMRSTFSLITAQYPHVLFRAQSPSDYGFSWDTILKWNASSVYVHDEGMGILKIVKTAKDEVVEFDARDIATGINDKYDNMGIFQHINNVKHVRISTTTEVVSPTNPGTKQPEQSILPSGDPQTAGNPPVQKPPVAANPTKETIPNQINTSPTTQTGNVVPPTRTNEAKTEVVDPNAPPANPGPELPTEDK